MKIKGSNKYLSFVKRRSRLYCSGVSSSHIYDYIELDYEVRKEEVKELLSTPSIKVMTIKYFI